MSDDFPDPPCVRAQINSSRGLRKSSWSHLAHNENSEPVNGLYTWGVNGMVWKNAREAFGHHLLHVRVERSAGERIHFSSSGSSLRVLLSLSETLHEPRHDRTHPC